MAVEGALRGRETLSVVRGEGRAQPRYVVREVTVRGFQCCAEDGKA